MWKNKLQDKLGIFQAQWWHIKFRDVIKTVLRGKSVVFNTYIGKE